MMRHLPLASMALVFAFIEGLMLARLVRSYGLRISESDAVDKFLSRATLKDVWRASCHAKMALLMVNLAIILGLRP